MLGIALIFLIILLVSSIISQFKYKKNDEEIIKNFKKQLYLKNWYEEIAKNIYGNEYIEEAEKEIVKKYNL